MTCSPAVHPLLGVLTGPPDGDGVLSWRLVIDARAWPSVDTITKRSLGRATAVLGELALAAGAEFFVLRCADVEVSGLRRGDPPVISGPVELAIVVTPIGPATARFEVRARSGKPMAVALLRARASSR
ncbi:hypothetical protein [Crossiella sp. NPDC003009]